MSTRWMKRGAVIVLTCLGLVAASAPAEAALILRLTSGGSSVTASTGADDLTIAASIGTFGVTVNIGQSTPADAQLELTSVAIATGGAGTLTMELTDTDYTAGIGSAGTLGWRYAGLLTGGTVTGQGWKDLNNEEFGTGPITTGVLGPFAPIFFDSGEGSTPHGVLTDPYSLTIRTVYTATGAGQTYIGTFRLQNAQTVPEPAELLLFGVGLTAFGFVIRRRRKTTPH